MAIIEAELTTYLTTQVPALSLYAYHIPESVTTVPVAVWSLTSADHVYHLGGAAGVCTKHYNFQIFSTDPLDCFNLAESIRLVLQGYAGSMGSVFVLTALLEDESGSEYYTPEDSTDAGLYMLSLDYSIKFREAVPSFTGV